MDTLTELLQNKTLSEWFESLAFQPKIFHPDFSFVNQSAINVCIGLCVLFFLLMRLAFPIHRLCRYTLRDFTNTCFTVHAWYTFLIWLVMLVEGGVQERFIVLTMGLNVSLVMLNRRLACACDRAMEKRIGEDLYRKAMDDAITLYQVNEAQCREVISDFRVIRSFLTLVGGELNYRQIHDPLLRSENGQHAFNDLVARHRLHRNLLDAPHLHQNLCNWRNYGKKEDVEEED